MCRRACVTSGLLLRTWIGALIAGLIVPRLLESTELPRSDQVLFGALAIGVGLLWSRYRREESPETKLRLAALAALVSVVLLSVTSAMPWIEGVRGLAPAHCNAAAVDLEIARWQAAATAVSMGQVTTLALLLPALIWLLVEPRQRAAQAAAAVGASVAGFTILAVLLYVESIPVSMERTLTWTPDLALLACSSIVVAAVLIVRQSFALLSSDSGLPRAYLPR